MTSEVIDPAPAGSAPWAHDHPHQHDPHHGTGPARRELRGSSVDIGTERRHVEFEPLRAPDAEPAPREAPAPAPAEEVPA